jgi:amino acid adenylation domain-containing protein
MSDPGSLREGSSAASVLDRLRAKREAALPTRVQRVPRDKPFFPVSDGQERLWLIDQMLPGSSAYSITAAVCFEGPLDPHLLELALGEVVRRHETLRTTFQTAGGVPVQVVAPPSSVTTFPVRILDLAGLAEPDREIERLAREEAEIPFDLARGPLLRVALLRLGPESHLLLLALHHIISDGWSMRVLLRETRILYQAYRERRPSPLPDLPIQHIDFVEWQQRWLASDAARRQLAYWKEQIGEHPPVLQLPSDRLRPTVQTLRGATHHFTVRRGLTDRIEQLSRSGGTTTFVTWLAAFQTLLHRLSHQTEILVGFPIANRRRVEIQDLIGFFVGTLVLRGEITAATRFRDHLLHLHRSALGAYDHQDLPFGSLIKELQLQRESGHSPLFQASFAYHNLEPPNWDLPGLRLTPRDFDRGTAMFDLTLVLRQGSDGAEGAFEYSTDLFDAPTVARFESCFQVLLEGILADPDGRISDLPLLSEAQRHLLLSWNDTAVAYAQATRCLHELILEQAARTPDAVAVFDEQKSLTYGELAARSARLARHLQTLGVGPEVRVGLCLERSVEMVVGLLGILSAGGAYVPLDPSYPLERLLYMLEDSAVEILLVRGSEAAVRPDLVGGRRLVDLDRLLDLPTSARADIGRGTLPDNLAYVIYTSGSTGRPKGVMNTHRSVVNRLLWGQLQYGLTREDRVLQKTPFSFDVSVWELFWPLLEGARLVMARPGGHQDGGYLVRTIAEQEITTLHFVPSMLAVFLETPGLEQCTSLRRVMASGEALSHGLQQRYFARLGAPLHNLYGPTEAAVEVTWWDCDPEDPRGLVPIGRPVANTAIHLLDPSFHAVPVGVAGQLCIGGVQVARGYLGRPDLTAEKFLPDPQGPAGARIYATGDLARRLPAGEIDYLGRIDHQVKVRGFRIELGEIESVLAAHPGVREAVVVAHSETAGARLVAYVVADAAANRGGLVNGLRRSCREALPEAMMPSAFVVLDALPLTPNGKVDRRALPAPPSSGSAVGESPGPRTPVEEIVAAIWSEVLRVERVGIEDSFFDLGGHSLLANQVVSRLREAFGMELSLRDFFAAPKVKDLARRLTTGEGGAALSAPPLVARPRRDGEPLSFAQQRLWFLHQLDPESRAYHVPIAVRLQGALAPEALASGLEGVVRRHEALRTTFALRADGPVQVIAPAAAWTLPVVDLSGLGATRREAEMQRLGQGEVSRPFDLTHGPLLRTSLVRLRPRESVLLAVMHHIVSDAWSMAVLWRDTAALYRSAVERRPADLPELPIQYSDFAQWQRELLSGEVLETQLSYWRRQLAGAPTLLKLPTDRPRPPVQRFRGGRQEFSLPAETTRRLQELGRREGATLFMTLLAAFDALLHRYSRQEDVVVGFPIAGRSRVETEGLIGLFINTLALRAVVPGASSWLALLRQVREVSLAGYGHQDLPFEKLVAELDIERSLAHAPLFQTLLAMQNIPALEVAVPDLTIELLDLGTGTAKFDLVLNVEETAGGLAGWWVYNSELFEAATVARMSGHFEALLTGILADPGRRISELELLSQAERRQVLEEWNDTAWDLGPERCLHALFEEQVERTPQAPAVLYEGRSLSYRELNARANRLAHLLRERGVGPEVAVGLFLERSLEMVVALYGVLKAGGLYVALAPSFPRERLAFMFEEARVPVLLAQRHLAAALPEIAAEVVCLDEEDCLAGYPEHNPASGAMPANAAYMIYTSGSTGRPKGVVVEHRQILHYVRSLVRLTAMEPGWSFAAVQSPAVDSSKSVLFPALLTGGCLHLISEERATDAEALGSCLVGQPPDVLKIAPSHLSALLSAGDPERLLPRRLLIYGGEPSRREWAQWLSGLSPELAMYSNYGPTETTVGSSMYRVRRGSVPEVAMLPLGRPFPNTRYYLLDRELQPVPVGVAGELYIGGPQVTRGYLRRSGLTAERYLPDPFSGEPGARMYRSGDVARYLPDGDLESLGRADHQVKIRGFRVELGEIESALARHPAVAACAVAAWEKSEGDRRLAAFVVLHSGEDPGSAGLRELLRERLPEYMVPSVFVPLAELPRTVHGKLDRQALVVPAGAGAEVEERNYAAPRNAAEQRMAKLWAEVLERERVGIHDNFFELGGHSLLATRLVSRIRDAFEAEMPLRRLFEKPTVAGLAEELATSGLTPLQAPPITVEPRDGAIPLSFAQERLWFLDRLLPDSAAYNIPVAVRLEGRLSVAVLRASLEKVIRRHEVLRTTFPLAGDEPVQRIAPPGPVPLLLVDLSGLEPEDRGCEAGRLAAAEAQRPFDLACGPLLRAQLVRLAPDEHLALLTLHHIVSDGWSTGVLVREIAALYQAFAAGRSSPLPELPIQYADFSLWQRRWLPEVEEAQLAYWRERLAGSPAVLDLPTDRPRPAVASSRGAVQTFKVAADLVGPLRQLGQREGATAFMVLLSGFEILLSRYSGQTDVAVGTPIAGRTRSEIEPLIGFFVNTLVLRVDVSGEPSWREVLSRVRAASLEAFAHQDLPFERLVETLAPERNLGHSPLFQVLFAYQNAPREPLRLPGLTLSFVPTETGTTKFDLALTFEEEGEGLRGALGYSRDLFDVTTAARMAEHLELALRAMVEDPEAPIRRAPLLTPAQRQALLVEWNDTRVASAAGRETVHGLFEAQAARTPESVAAICGGEAIRYGELNTRANRLARYLRRLGVGPEVLVGVCMERTLDLVVSLLGVLKAGGAYVPLDPHYPTARLELILADSAAPVVLVADSMGDALPAVSARVVSLKEERQAIGRESAEDLEPQAERDNLAYLIYTSGSTGRPKGVAIEHHNAVTLIGWSEAVYGREGLSSVLASTSVCFDLSVYELFAPLSCGGRFVLVDNALEAKPQLEVTLINTVPSAAAELARLGSLPATVRMVNLAGEALPRTLVDQLYAQGRVERVFNLYGPSEDTTYSTWARMERVEAGAPSIGRPIAETSAYVVDRAGELGPLGAVGELLLAGGGLARGYLGRPDLTAERFVPDPYSGEAGSRLYRTGDLVRWRPDGRLDFLGRLDHQVKLRGFRIELGEIESTLSQLEGVREAVVAAREDFPGDLRLVAYATVEPDGPTVDRLREHLQERLPAHMVPSAFLLLESLPRTTTGKVDRQALVVSAGAGAEVKERTYVAPRNAAEQRMAELWAEVLKRERVGVHDNFFELGGHSLLTVRLVARIRQEFGRDLPIAVFFQGATLERLTSLTLEGPDHRTTVLVSLQPGRPNRPPFFCVHGVGGDVFSFTDLSDRLGGEQPFYGLQAPDPKEGEQPLTSIEEMAVHYLQAVRSVQPQGPYHLGGWSLGGVIAFEMARRLQESGEEVALLVLIDSFAPESPAPQAGGSASEDGLKLIFEQARQRSILPEDFELSDAKTLFRIFRRNFLAMRAFQPRPYPGRLILLRAEGSPAAEPDHGWSRLAREVEVDSIPGDHYSILSKPHVEVLAERLKTRLDEALADDRP